MLGTHHFFSFPVHVQSVGGRGKKSYETRILHFDPRPPAGGGSVRLLKKGSVVQSLPLEDVQAILFDEADPRSVIISASRDRDARLLIDFETVEDCMCFRLAFASVALTGFDPSPFNSIVVMEGGVAKRGLSGWKGRYAVLVPRRLILLSSRTSAYPRTVLSLAHCTPRLDAERRVLHVEAGGREVQLRLGNTRQQALAWLTAANRACATSPLLHPPPPSPGSSSSRASSNTAGTHPVAHAQPISAPRLPLPSLVPAPPSSHSQLHPHHPHHPQYQQQLQLHPPDLYPPPSQSSIGFDPSVHEAWQARSIQQSSTNMPLQQPQQGPSCPAGPHWQHASPDTVTQRPRPHSSSHQNASNTYSPQSSQGGASGDTSAMVVEGHSGGDVVGGVDAGCATDSGLGYEQEENDDPMLDLASARAVLRDLQAQLRTLMPPKTQAPQGQLAPGLVSPPGQQAELGAGALQVPPQVKQQGGGSRSVDVRSCLKPSETRVASRSVWPLLGATDMDPVHAHARNLCALDRVCCAVRCPAAPGTSRTRDCVPQLPLHSVIASRRGSADSGGGSLQQRQGQRQQQQACHGRNGTWSSNGSISGSMLRDSTVGLPSDVVALLGRVQGAQQRCVDLYMGDEPGVAEVRGTVPGRAMQRTALGSAHRVPTLPPSAGMTMSRAGYGTDISQDPSLSLQQDSPSDAIDSFSVWDQPAVPAASVTSGRGETLVSHSSPHGNEVMEIRPDISHILPGLSLTLRVRKPHPPNSRATPMPSRTPSLSSTLQGFNAETPSPMAEAYTGPGHMFTHGAHAHPPVPLPPIPLVSAAVAAEDLSVQHTIHTPAAWSQTGSGAAGEGQAGEHRGGSGQGGDPQEVTLNPWLTNSDQRHGDMHHHMEAGTTTVKSQRAAKGSGDKTGGGGGGNVQERQKCFNIPAELDIPFHSTRDNPLYETGEGLLDGDTLIPPPPYSMYSHSKSHPYRPQTDWHTAQSEAAMHKGYAHSGDSRHKLPSQTSFTVEHTDPSSLTGWGVDSSAGKTPSGSRHDCSSGFGCGNCGDSTGVHGGGDGSRGEVPELGPHAYATIMMAAHHARESAASAVSGIMAALQSSSYTPDARHEGSSSGTIDGRISSHTTLEKETAGLVTDGGCRALLPPALSELKAPPARTVNGGASSVRSQMPKTSGADAGASPAPMPSMVMARTASGRAGGGMLATRTRPAAWVVQSGQEAPQIQAKNIVSSSTASTGSTAAAARVPPRSGRGPLMSTFTIPASAIAVDHGLSGDASPPQPHPLKDEPSDMDSAIGEWGAAPSSALDRSNSYARQGSGAPPQMHSSGGRAAEAAAAISNHTQPGHVGWAPSPTATSREDGCRTGSRLSYSSVARTTLSLQALLRELNAGDLSPSGFLQQLAHVG